MTTPKVPQAEPERTEWVKYQLRLRGLSMADVARDLKLERSTPRKVFERPYPAVEARIGMLLGLPPAAIWPERYVVRAPVRLPVARRSRRPCPHVAANTTRRHGRKSTTTSTNNEVADGDSGDQR